MSMVLVVDDKEMMRDSVSGTLQRAGFSVLTADSGEAALGLIAQRRPDAVVTDMKMPGLGGLDLLERVRGIDDELPVVVMTAFAAVDTAVRAIKLGAFDYLTKPFEGDELVIAVKRAIGHAKLLRENALLRAGTGADAPRVNGSAAAALSGLSRLIGDSPAMRRVKEQVLAVAKSQGTVLIHGESGTGKEVVARAVHELSPRGSAPFLPVNCAALSESLLESELFGHERGAFTGADKLRKGRFELADGGTILLDEVSEVGAPVQAKLLRVLQERTFERVGSSLSIGVDVRVVATSNRDLPRAVGAGAFRQDLFFRLNVLPVHLPPLRERLEDVPALATYFVGLIRRREGQSEVRFDDRVLDLMRTYSWPGNVRELQNICERAVVLTQPDAGGARTIRAEMIEPWLAAGAAAGAAPRAASTIENKPSIGGPTDPVTCFANGSPRKLEDIERDAIIQALRSFNGHRLRTARALGIGVRTLGLKLKKWKQLQLVAESL
ncbi:MAG: sigma-54-dependent transcriptional regulator [Phycisphaerales bacterium]